MRRRLLATNVVMTALGSLGVSAGLLLPLVIVHTDATSAITPGVAPSRPDMAIAMTPEDVAQWPACRDIRTWPKQQIPARLLVVRSNGDRALLSLGVAFAAVKQSKTRPELAIWVIGACTHG